MSRIDNCHSHRSHGCGDDNNDHKSNKADSHSGKVKYNNEEYNLNTEAGRDAFEEAIEADGADYNRATNEVTVGEGKDKKTYDLDETRGRKRFKDDARDDIIDGKKNSENIRFGEDVYELSDETDRDAFESAIESDTVDYNKAQNKVTVEDENGKKKTYNLDTEKGRRAFRDDARDGALDGRKDSEVVELNGGTYNLRTEDGRERLEDDIEGAGVEYDKAKNKVTIEGDDGEETTYDLNTVDGRRAFKKDFDDGQLDGAADKYADKSDKSDKSDRSSGRGHLRDVEYNGTSYNLNNKTEEEAFRTELMKDPNVTYIAAENKVMVGEKTYNLDNPEEFHAFRQDLVDGKLDGAKTPDEYSYDKSYKLDLQPGEYISYLTNKYGRRA